MKHFLLLAFIALSVSASAQCPPGMVSIIGNVVNNGDFSQGNTGFSSQYTYCNTNNCLQPWAMYAVGTSGRTYHTAFRGVDHTTGTGNFMIVNGAGFANVSVWCQTITVTPNTLYLFETWVSSMVAGSPARLQFSINGTLAGPVFTAPSSQNVWMSFNATWHSGNNTTATICIVNQNTDSGGNDFGLDDITFKPCTCNFELPPLNDTTVCEGASVQLSLPPGADTYKWTSSASISCDTCTTILVGPSSTATVKAAASLNGCADSASVVVNVQPAVDAAWSVPPPVCAGGIIALDDLVTGTPGGTWSGQGVDADSFRSSGLSGNVALTYSITSGVCSDLSTQQLAILQAGGSSRSESICAGGSVQLPWGATASTAGNYSHIYTAVNGCDSLVTIAVDVKPVAEVSVTSNKSVMCATDSAEVCAPQGYPSYQWNVRESTVCIVVKQPGNYAVTVTDNNNCISQSDPVYISVYPPTPVSIVAQGSNLSSYGANTYQWMHEGKAISGANSSTYKASESGIYSLRITDENGCENTSTGIYITQVGIDDLENSLAFGFYPNPAHSRLIVVVSKELVGEELSMYDVNGKLVLTSNITNEQTELNLSGISTGMYFVKVGGGVKKLVVE